MKQRLAIAALTIGVLVAGYAAGVWTERNACKVPPAPAPLMGELSNSKRSAAPASTSRPEATRLATEIDRLRPQIEAFRERMDEIDREMDRDIDAMLRPDQRELFRALVKKYADLRAKENDAAKLTTPLTGEEITQLQQQPLYKMLGIVVVPLRVEWNTRDLKLDEQQRQQLTAILRARRDKFLALVDSSPPPTLQLSRLAPMAQRLVEPKP